MRRFSVALLLAAGCLPPQTTPGMSPAAPRPHDRDLSLVELARVAPALDDQRALLVVYPRDACSGSASMVLVDDGGGFLGAVGPGSAALLSIPKTTRALYAMSSVEVYAPVTTWAARFEVVLPPAPGGLVFRTRRFDARLCGNGQYADPIAASKDELEEILADADLRWLELRRDDGQAWLDAHRERVREVIARGTADDVRAR